MNIRWVELWPFINSQWRFIYWHKYQQNNKLWLLMFWIFCQHCRTYWAETISEDQDGRTKVRSVLRMKRSGEIYVIIEKMRFVTMPTLSLLLTPDVVLMTTYRRHQGQRSWHYDNSWLSVIWMSWVKLTLGLTAILSYPLEQSHLVYRSMMHIVGANCT